MPERDLFGNPIPDRPGYMDATTGESVRLFTPAPEQMPGQTIMAPPPRIDRTATHVLVTCQRGHLFEAVRIADWAHSPAESRSRTPRPCAACDRLHGTQP